MLNILKRGIYISKNQGVLTALKKGIKFFWARSISTVGSLLYTSNSKQYWDFRMKYDWNFVGGGEQSSYFTAGMFANIELSNLKSIKSVIDYGCATGDPSIFLKIFFPKSNIYLYDISEIGVSKALMKYSRFIPVFKHEDGNKYELVYSSNVIEHVKNPKLFVDTLILLSEKFIIIQCPWEEMHPVNGKLISPDNQTAEHTWTIDNDFYEKYIQDERVDWQLTKGEVPMAWQGGIQAFYFGKLK